METFEPYSLKIPRRCRDCASSSKAVTKSPSVLEEIQMASEGWRRGSSFRGAPHQPGTSQAGDGVFNMIMEQGTFWRTQAPSWGNSDIAQLRSLWARTGTAISSLNPCFDAETRNEVNVVGKFWFLSSRCSLFLNQLLFKKMIININYYLWFYCFGYLASKFQLILMLVHE